MAQFRGARRLWPTSGLLVFTRDTIRGRENFLYTRTISSKRLYKEKKKKLKRTEGRLNDTRHYKNCIHKILDYSIQIVYERWNICNRPINF